MMDYFIPRGDNLAFGDEDCVELPRASSSSTSVPVKVMQKPGYLADPNCVLFEDMGHYEREYLLTGVIKEKVTREFCMGLGIEPKVFDFENCDLPITEFHNHVMNEIRDKNLLVTINDIRRLLFRPLLKHTQDFGRIFCKSANRWLLYKPSRKLPESLLGLDKNECEWLDICLTSYRGVFRKSFGFSITLLSKKLHDGTLTEKQKRQLEAITVPDFLARLTDGDQRICTRPCLLQFIRRFYDIDSGVFDI